MRAIAIEDWGGVDALKLRDDLPDPPLSPDGVKIAVRAAAVNPVDTKIREGKLAGLFPAVFPLIPGWDVAGVVEAVGPAVTEFVPGEEVYAYGRTSHLHLGTYAEYVVLPADHVAARPPSLSFEESAAIPLAALTATQMLDRVLVTAADTVLVPAGAGGVGHFAIQLAKARGATVVATAGPDNQDFLRELGADCAIDYTAGPLGGQLRDAGLTPTVGLDIFGGDMREEVLGVLDDQSRLVSIAGPPPDPPSAYVFVRPNAAQLRDLAQLAERGQLKPHLDEVFPLERAADAHARIEEGHVRGKLVLTV